MRTPASAALFAFTAAIAFAPAWASAQDAATRRQDEFRGVIFATTPAEDWQSVWSDHSQASQIRKLKTTPSRREALQNGCEALGSIVTELGSLSGRCVT